MSANDFGIDCVKKDKVLVIIFSSVSVLYVNNFESSDLLSSLRFKFNYNDLKTCFMKKGILLFFLCLSFIASFAATYYSQGVSVDANSFSSWNTNRAGGGASPANFTAGDIFVIQNGHTATTSAAWTLSGTGNKIQIESGGILTNIFLVTTTTFQVDNGGTYNHNYVGTGTNGASTDFPGTTTKLFGATSTVNINAWGGASSSPAALPTIAAPGWGNLKLKPYLK